MTIGNQVRLFTAAPGEIIAWRVWRVNKQGLVMSVVNGKVWLPGEPITGDIHKEDRGVFAWKASKPREYGFYQDKFVLFGSVWLWGEVAEHRLGYRAEFGAVRSFEKFVRSPKCTPFDIAPKLELFRKQYGVEL